MASQATGYLCSFPKSGRTWMRFALANYLTDVLDLDLAVDLRTMFRLLPNMDNLGPDPGKDITVYAFGDRDDVPLILSSHLRYDEVRFSGAPIVHLVRDPRDVLVSQYFQKTRQDFTWTGEMKAFVRDATFGAADLIGHLNSWAPVVRSGDQGRVACASYEALRADPAAGFARLAAHLGVRIDASAVQRALDAASVDRMRSVEKRVGINGYDYDRNDPEALRVRRAKVGGFGDYLDVDDLAYFDEVFASTLTEDARALLAEHGLAFWESAQPTA